jgi:hypothetical protein
MFPLNHWHQRHLYVWWVPAFGALFWFSTLMVMLISWLAAGRPHYPWQHTKYPYISDIGAGYLKPLFVTASCISATSFFSSLVIERCLRHSGRLIPDMRIRERLFNVLAIISGFIGAISLVLLSIFDKRHYSTVHGVLLVLHILGLSFSGIFTVSEFHWISKGYAAYHQLKIAYIAKAIIVTVLVTLSIALGISWLHNLTATPILEWIVGFGVTFYYLTFVYDLCTPEGCIHLD